MCHHKQAAICRYLPSNLLSGERLYDLLGAQNSQLLTCQFLANLVFWLNGTQTRKQKCLRYKTAQLCTLAMYPCPVNPQARLSQHNNITKQPYN